MRCFVALRREGGRGRAAGLHCGPRVGVEACTLASREGGQRRCHRGCTPASHVRLPPPPCLRARTHTCQARSPPARPAPPAPPCSQGAVGGRQRVCWAGGGRRHAARGGHAVLRHQAAVRMERGAVRQRVPRALRRPGLPQLQPLRVHHRLCARGWVGGGRVYSAVRYEGEARVGRTVWGHSAACPCPARAAAAPST